MKVLLSTVMAMALVVSQPAQALAQAATIGAAVPLRSLTMLLEREAVRLARSPLVQRQLPPANQPSGSANCSKGKGALIGAIVGGATTALFVAQAESNRRAGTSGAGAGIMAAQIATGAGVGALAGMLACR